MAHGRAAGRQAEAVAALAGAVAAPVLRSDRGHAWTLSYRIEPTSRFSGGIEWLRIDSRRDLWPMFYGTPPAQTEDQLRLQLSYRLAAPAR